MQALALSPPPCVLRRLTDVAVCVIKVTATVRTSPPPLVALNMTDAQTGMKLKRSGDWFQRAQSNQHIKREVLKRLQKVGIQTHTPTHKMHMYYKLHANAQLTTEGHSIALFAI